MASWMVHLRLAEKLLHKIEGLDAEQFAIGNVAPDSGIALENGRFYPPKEISHYSERTDPPSLYHHREICFYRDYLVEVDQSDSKRYSFLLGYLFHLITDNLWIIDIWRPTKDKFFEGRSPSADWVQEIKADWVGQDFLYLQQHPNAFFYKPFLNFDYPESLFDLMPQENIQLALQRIKDFYQVDANSFQQQVDRDYVYLNQREGDLFVEDTTDLLYDLYEMVWGGKKRPFSAVKRSLLECLSANETIPVQNEERTN